MYVLMSCSTVQYVLINLLYSQCMSIYTHILHIYIQFEAAISSIRQENI